MSNAVLDASALLALLFQETGGEKVLKHLPESLLSAVNLAEVLAKAVERGMTLEEANELLAEFPCEIVPFDREAASLTAALRVPTRSAGLSFGDRACLALGMKTGLPVVTADRQWDQCGLKVRIIQIRA